MFGIKRLVLNDHNIKLRVLLFGVTTTALSYKMIKTGFWILKDRTCDCFFFSKPQVLFWKKTISNDTRFNLVNIIKVSVKLKPKSPWT